MILFQIIQKPQKRGAEIFAAQLSEHLEKLGHTVILISLFEGVSELPFSGKKIQLNRPISKRWYDYEAWKQIARLVKEFKPDIIQCNAGDTLKFITLSKLFLRNINTNWINHIVKIVEKDNKTPHSSIAKLTPDEATDLIYQADLGMINSYKAKKLKVKSEFKEGN